MYTYRLYLSNVYPSLSVQFSSVAQSCLTLCDPMNRSTPQLSSVYLLGFPGSSDGKESAHNAGDLGSIPGSGRSPGVGNGNSLQYSHLENSRDRGAWWATVHGVARGQTRMSH